MMPTITLYFAVGLRYQIIIKEAHLFLLLWRKAEVAPLNPTTARLARVPGLVLSPGLGIGRHQALIIKLLTVICQGLFPSGMP
jgi:hypothetical protein